MLLRKISNNLISWKTEPNRKVLLIRGARQVGKTFSVREFSRSFDNSIEVNFIEKAEVKSFFQTGSLSPSTIIPKLEAYFGQRLTPGKSLLFFDEIQACQEALQSLRFFYEQMPELHVVAAGSLLEFALSELPSFGVGRISSIFMYPLSFSEFVSAMGESNILDYTASHVSKTISPIDEPFHKKLLELLRLYMIVGGLPAAVDTYLNSHDLLSTVRVLDSLILDYEDDFAKYKTRIDPLKIRNVLRSTAKQAGKKFVHELVSPGESTSGISNALDLLALAGLVYKIQKTSGNGIPLGGEVVEKYVKTIPFDIGMYNRILGVPPSDIMKEDLSRLVHVGANAEVFCGLEIISSSDPFLRGDLYYWRRDVKGSQAEVDYLVQKGTSIIPIEVKAGTKGQMQSLYRFMFEKNCLRGVRVSSENFSVYPAPVDKVGGNGERIVEVVPMYFVGGYLGR